MQTVPVKTNKSSFLTERVLSTPGQQCAVTFSSKYYNNSPPLSPSTRPVLSIQVLENLFAAQLFQVNRRSSFGGCGGGSVGLGSNDFY